MRRLSFALSAVEEFVSHNDGRRQSRYVVVNALIDGIDLWMRLLINWAIQLKEISALIIPLWLFASERSRWRRKKELFRLFCNRLPHVSFTHLLPAAKNHVYREKLVKSIPDVSRIRWRPQRLSQRIFNTPSRVCISISAASNGATLFRNARRETIYLRRERVVKELLRHCCRIWLGQFCHACQVFSVFFFLVLLSLRERRMVL